MQNFLLAEFMHIIKKMNVKHLNTGAFEMITIYILLFDN